MPTDDGADLTNAELAELYRRYGFLLRRRGRTLLRDEALAEDALQTAFVKIIESRAALARAENRLAWMYRVVDRCCFDLLRRRRVRRTEPIDGRADTALAVPGVDVEARDAVLRVLGELSDSEYEVAVLAYVDGTPQTEIASTLGLSRPTIWKRLLAIRERAARLLEVTP
ncbi:MAG TPA: sigma-70 family RNA polymerase sigma factor [Polyangia bacterium]|nr:sigma-70 family RNA polymerase sigma factor [Polyangia bacterium]